MVVGMAGMGAVDASGKWLVTADYSPVQVIAVRGWFIAAALILWAAASGKLGELQTARPVGHLVRLAVGLAGPLFMFSALRHLPLVEVTVIIFGSAFLTTALAVPLFGERIGWHRWAAVACGFLGVVLALRPGIDIFQPAAVFALLASAAFAGINLTARWLRETETLFQLVFFLMIGMAVVASLFLPFVWKPMPPGDLAIFALMGVFTIIGYHFMTRAFTDADVGAVAPFEYSILLWAFLYGFVIWGELPDGFVWGGAAVIVAAGIYMVHRESRRGN